jgi:hypothetical protein
MAREARWQGTALAAATHDPGLSSMTPAKIRALVDRLPAPNRVSTSAKLPAIHPAPETRACPLSHAVSCTFGWLRRLIRRASNPAEAVAWSCFLLLTSSITGRRLLRISGCNIFRMRVALALRKEKNGGSLQGGLPTAADCPGLLEDAPNSSCIRFIGVVTLVLFLPFGTVIGCHKRTGILCGGVKWREWRFRGWVRVRNGTMCRHEGFSMRLWGSRTCSAC